MKDIIISEEEFVNYILDGTYLGLFKYMENPFDCNSYVQQISFKNFVKSHYDFRKNTNKNLKRNYILSLNSKINAIAIMYILYYCKIDENFVKKFLVNNNDFINSFNYNKKYYKKLFPYIDLFPSKFKLIYGKYFK